LLTFHPSGVRRSSSWYVDRARFSFLNRHHFRQ